MFYAFEGTLRVDIPHQW